MERWDSKLEGWRPVVASVVERVNEYGDGTYTAWVIRQTRKGRRMTFELLRGTAQG